MQVIDLTPTTFLATPSPDDPAGNNSESEDEDDLGEEGQMDPAERERERKSSQQRITAIVHAITPSSEAANLQTESQDPFDPGEEEFLDSLVASVTTSKQVCICFSQFIHFFRSQTSWLSYLPTLAVETCTFREKF